MKFSELDNSITIVKSENNGQPVFCAKPFLMLLTAMADSARVDTLSISFYHRGKRFHVNYDAGREEEYIEIGILDSPEDYSAEDYEKIWEILKDYENRTDKTSQENHKTAIGE